MHTLSPWLIVLAGAVYGGIQLLKLKFPALCGRHAVLVNLAFTAAGVLAFVAPDQIFTVATAQAIVTAALLAAGMHGTVSKLSAPTACVALLGLALLPMTGCRVVRAGTPATAAKLPAGAVDGTDAAANEVLQAAHGFTASIIADVQAGKLKLNGPQSDALVALSKSLNVADAAEIAYHRCGGGTACSATVLVSAVAQVEASFGTATVTMAATAQK